MEQRCSAARLAAPAVVRRGEGPKAGSGRLVRRQGRLLGVQFWGKGGRIGGFPSGRRAAAQEMAGGLAGHARGAGLCPL